MYIKFKNEDYGKVMVFVSENNIKCESFDNLYDQFIKEEVEYFIENVNDVGCNILNPHEENLISNMGNGEKEILLDKAVEDIVSDREYLINVIDKEVEYGVRNALKELFVKATEVEE